MGSSLEVWEIIKCGEEAGEGARFACLRKICLQALNEASLGVHLGRCLAARALGAGENADKGGLARRALVDDMGDGEEEANIGMVGGASMSVLTHGTRETVARDFARFCIERNGRVLDEVRRGLKRAHNSLPFPKELETMSDALAVHHIWCAFADLEFPPEKSEGEEQHRMFVNDLRMGSVGEFLWASALLHNEDGEIIGFRDGPAMATLCNSFLHITKLCILYHRIQSHGGAQGRQNLVFNSSASAVTLTKLRQVLNDQGLGLEKTKHVKICVPETERKGSAVITVQQKNGAPVMIGKLDIRAGIANAHVLLRDHIAEIFVLLGVSVGDSREMCDVYNECITLDTLRNDIREFKIQLESEAYSHSHDLRGALLGEFETMDFKSKA